MKKRLVLAINYFSPDYASTGQLMTELCLQLQDEFDLIVIAAQPGDSISNKRFEEEMFENIQVIRVRLPFVDKMNKISRLKYIASYFVFSLYAVFQLKNVSTIFTISSPPILGGLIGTLSKMLMGTKHIYNIQDFNPEQAEAIKYSSKKWIYRVARIIDNINCKFADHVVTVGRDMQDTLHKRFRGSKVPVNSVINNWVDENDVVPLSRENTQVRNFILQHNLQDKFIVMYSGNLGLYYDLENLIRVPESFREHNDIAFVFIGDGAVKRAMKEFVDDQELDNVYFLPFQPKEFVKYSLNAADVHLVVNQKGIKGVSVPSKIYGVMAAGKPIIGVLEQGSEAERLIQESQSGVIVAPKDYSGVVEAIHMMYSSPRRELDQLGWNGRSYLEKHLRKAASIEKYRAIFRNI